MKKPSFGIADILLVISVPLFLVGIASFIFCILGVVSFILGLRIVIKSKPKYVLLLNTKDGVIKDLVTKNRNQIELISDAITASNSNNKKEFNSYNIL